MVKEIRNAVMGLRYGGNLNNPILKNIPGYARRSTLKRIFYSSPCNFFYARIPKNANSTLVRTFSSHLGFPVESDPSGKLAKDKFNLYPTLDEYKRAYKVVILRDPIVRAVSSWLDKGHNPGWIKKFQFCGDETTIPTLRQFIESIYANEFYHDGHFIPQTKMIPGSILDYRVALLDDIEIELPKICEEAFGKWKGMELKSEGRTNAHLVADNLDGATRSMIEKIYESDMEAYYVRKF